MNVNATHLITFISFFVVYNLIVSGIIIYIRKNHEKELEHDRLAVRVLTRMLKKKLLDQHNANAAIAEARRVNRAAMARKWVRKMNLEADLMARLDKIQEEYCELFDAIHFHQEEKIADAVADMQFVLETIPILMKYDGNEVFKRVYESNMTKDPALFAIDNRGKGDGYEPPELRSCLYAR